ncbi:substrate-binding periplasmic protein [Parachitinimonas caeni]|uniref:Transporter substrate-binding domain-containing protein n=1 Tax=Parachitinimonas caeni TaxID=3031301 RepID=A0ABT7E2Z2_9NEIS|nr:transporter substrate-binding domain-containing protein [Parachitinimonas caeni]MDK2126686.1 transporter substrate-binding domain-containing protein [Parachitinimonas caeni]
MLVRSTPILLAAWLLAFASSAGAAEPIRKIVCHNDVLAPYFMRNGPTFNGINVDMLVEAAKRLSIPLEIKEMPWKRVEFELQKSPAGEVECAFAFSRTPAREQYMEYTNVVMQRTEYVLFVRKGAGIKGLKDLEGKTIGVRRGFRQPDAIAEGAANGRFQTEEAGSDTSNFQKLSLGRIDAVMINFDVGMYMLKEMGLAGSIQPIGPSLFHLDNFLVFGKGKGLSHLIPLFDREFERMQQDGSYARIRARYIDDKALVLQ